MFTDLLNQDREIVYAEIWRGNKLSRSSKYNKGTPNSYLIETREKNKNGKGTKKVTKLTDRDRRYDIKMNFGLNALPWKCTLRITKNITITD